MSAEPRDEAALQALLAAVRFDERGLVPVVAQARDGRVLMLAWADAEALRRTLETGFAHYRSRSRNRLWKKGESSGHVQRLLELRLDCDSDTLLYRVEPAGPACHEGTDSCFSRVAGTRAWRREAPPDAAR